MTARLLIITLAVAAVAALGGYLLAEHHFIQAVWLLLGTWTLWILVYWKPKSIKAFFGYAFGEVVFTVIVRMIAGFIRLLLH